MSRPHVTREEWLVARRALLQREKEHTRQNDALALERRALPWVRIDADYRFDTDRGARSLAELFDGRSQLLVYHFMFGPTATVGCPSCSVVADTFDGAVVHLANHDVTMLAVSRGPLAALQAYRERMGWRFQWVSSLGSAFNFDFGVSFTPETGADATYNYAPLSGLPAGPHEAHGLSAFALEDGVVYHTYSAYARGCEVLMGVYPLLDRAPKGRNEGNPMEYWFRRRGEYDPD